MTRLIFACFLLGAVEALAQPEVRVYYNPFEWVGVSAGTSVARWRYELSGSWHQEKFTGLMGGGYYDENGQYLGPVFENDVWTLQTTTTTLRVLRSGKKERPRFSPYYGLHLRLSMQHYALKEQHWDALDEAYADEYGTLTANHIDDLCLGFVLGARGTIAQNVFWDVNLSLLPISNGYRRQYYTNRPHDSFGGMSYTYYDYDLGHLLQIGVGYKFRPKKSD